MAFAKPSPLPPFLTKHCISSFRLFFLKFPCQNCSHSLRTNAFYTEGFHALTLAPWKEKLDSPSDPDDISILNNRIRKELGKRQGLTAGDRILDSAEAEDYIKTVKQQQQMGLQKLKGDAQETGGFGYRADPYALQPGDIVVHKKVGIGRFVAIKYDVSRSSSEPTEYVFIEYADGMAKLPVKQACRMLYRYNL